MDGRVIFELNSTRHDDNDTRPDRYPMHADAKKKRHFNLFIFLREQNDFFIQTGNVNWQRNAFITGMS